MIRRATVSDAAPIAYVHVRSWQAAYHGLIPQSYLDTLAPAGREPLWTSLLATADWPRSGTLVAADPDVFGFAHLLPTRDEDADPTTVGEITSIYLLPDHWGNGLGQQLMAAALDAFAEAGYREASLWVLDTNDRAQRFYRAGGWHPDGASKLDTKLGIPLREIRYRRPL